MLLWKKGKALLTGKLLSNRALSDQYYETDMNHKRIREQVCDFLEKHEDIYMDFVEGDQSFDHYVKTMRQDGTYGGNMELAAFARMRRIDIKVYQPGMMYMRYNVISIFRG